MSESYEYPSQIQVAKAWLEAGYSESHVARILGIKASELRALLVADRNQKTA